MPDDQSEPTEPAGSPFDQHGYRLRFDWGPGGLRALSPHVDVVVIVDVLRFTTCVDVAVSRGATVLPYLWRDGSEAEFAADNDAELAGNREDPTTPWSLSPTDLGAIPAGTRLVLPSPNGSALAFSARQSGAEVYAGCLRNASAVAAAATSSGATVAVLAAGERWRMATGPVRPALEDLLGAGAILAAALNSYQGSDAASPEARTAAASFEAHRTDLLPALFESASGRELRGRGWDDDVVAAAAHDVSQCAPVLSGEGEISAFVDLSRRRGP